MIVAIPADYDLLYIVYHFRPLIQLLLLYLFIMYISWYFQLIIEVLPITISSKPIITTPQVQPQRRRQIDFTNNNQNVNVINLIKTLWPIPLII